MRENLKLITFYYFYLLTTKDILEIRKWKIAIKPYPRKRPSELFIVHFNHFIDRTSVYDAYQAKFVGMYAILRHDFNT